MPRNKQHFDVVYVNGEASMAVIQKKICVLGDSAVGKTSLVRRYVEGRFDDKDLSSIGVKISRTSINRGTHILNFLIWDLAKSYNTRAQNYLRGAVGALLVCDLTRYETLDYLLVYANQIRDVNTAVSLVLLGNKLDLKEQRVIKNEALSTVSQALDSPYILTSAKTGRCVATAFTLLADQVEGIR